MGNLEEQPVTFAIYVNGTPTPQGSKKGFIQGGRVVLVESSSKNKTWRKQIAATVQSKSQEIRFTEATAINLDFFMPKAKSNKKPAMTQKPDLDKLVRSVLDGLVDSGILEDDSRITKLTATKNWAQLGNEGVFVVIRHAETTPNLKKTANG